MFRILKWVIAVPMAFLLLLGSFILWGALELSRSSPSDIGDLAWINIRVQKVTPKSENTLIKSEEYHTIFTIKPDTDGQPITILVKSGDRIQVRVKKEVAEHLKDTKLSYVYGLKLSDGRELLDGATPIPTPFGMSPSDLVKLIGVPILYFVFMIFGTRIWAVMRVRLAQSRHPGPR